VLLDERGGRPYAEPLEYVVPTPKEGTFGIPAGLITNGWIHVLEDAEVALLLMTACKVGSITTGDVVAVPGEIRLLHYGIGRDAFEAHRMLTQLDLLHVDEVARHDDGRAMDYSDDGAQLHRLRLLPRGFEQEAWTTTTSSIERLLAKDASYSVRKAPAHEPSRQT
jgi:hypothetical protein